MQPNSFTFPCSIIKLPLSVRRRLKVRNAACSTLLTSYSRTHALTHSRLSPLTSRAHCHSFLLYTADGTVCVGYYMYWILHFCHSSVLTWFESWNESSRVYRSEWVSECEIYCISPPLPTLTLCCDTLGTDTFLTRTDLFHTTPHHTTLYSTLLHTTPLYSTPHSTPLHTTAVLEYSTVLVCFSLCSALSSSLKCTGPTTWWTKSKMGI